MVQTRSSQMPHDKSNGHLNGHVNGQLTSLSGVTQDTTDYSRWRLLDEDGRHTWHYLATDEQVKDWPQSTYDKYHLGLEKVCC